MDRIFYKADVVDAYTNYPYYIFDTSYLPSPDAIDYNLFIPTLMEHLPSEPYLVIMFSCGLNKVSWMWGIKFLKAFLTPDSDNARNVDNVHKIIAVHESWFVKSISQILTNFSLSKKKLSTLFDLSKRNNILVSCDTLAALSHHVDITRLKLSLNIYKHDAHITLLPAIDLGFPADTLITPLTRFSPASDPIFYHHFYQIFHIVDTYGHKVELLFHRPGKKLSTDILFMCLARNQLLWINDWDLNCIASCFKKILHDVSSPLLPVDMIALPMRDDFDYTLGVFNKIMTSTLAPEVLFQVLLLCEKIVVNTHITKHTPASLLKCLCHALTHELISQQNKHRISMAVRFMKNLLTHWRHIKPLYARRFSTVQQVIDGEDLHDATIDELYNMSHEITMDDVDSADDEPYSTSKNTLSTDVASGLNDSDTLLDLKHPPLPAGPSLDVASSLNDTLLDKQHPPIPARERAVEPEAAVLEPKTLAKLHDISNVQLQYPPQKYKFERPVKEPSSMAAPPKAPPKQVKVPVVRGRKVGELAKLFEEREQAMEILRTM